MSELIGEITGAVITGDSAAEIASVAYDSRRAREGGLFVAMRGLKSDGHDFIPEAIRLGARAVVVERDRSVGPELSRKLSAVASVPDPRSALVTIATTFYGHPARKLSLVGITGTNGKTTTAALIRAVLDLSGTPTGLFGTTGYQIGEDAIPAPNTTPESLDLQEMLARLVSRGGRYAVMEVSSHALALGRVAGCEYDLAVFTNLTRDHLDFHPTMEEYFAAKRRLFDRFLKTEDPGPGRVRAVVGTDESWGRTLARSLRLRRWTFGLEPGADITAERLDSRMDGTSFTVKTPAGSRPIESPLVGRYNALNLLAAIGAGLGMGFDLDRVVEAVARVRHVPGRFERVDEGQDFAVIVDYAHTEDALERLLAAGNELARGRIITVFGCGGDRDRGKRPRMGRIAVGYSDLAIITSDNPRTEDPAAIIREIEGGARDVSPGGLRSGGPSAGGEVRVLPDRTEAIHAAIAGARSGDVVIIAGKGHEDCQIIGTERIHFDDREVARDILRGREKR